MMILADQPVRVSEVLVVTDARAIKHGLGSISTGPDLEDAPNIANNEMSDDASSASNIFSRPRVTFDWTDAKTSKKFARLEAKLLADKADEEEQSLYRQMRASRRLNSDGRLYLLRYDETERMKTLSKKLAEIHRLLAPMPTTQ